jgi:hypothetical protein
MATERELLEREARVLGEETAFRFLKRHIADFDRTTESSKKIADYLKEYNLEFNDDNLEIAFRELKARGVSFVAAPVEEPLPEVPGMGEPQIFTKADIDDMPSERYKKLYFGPSAAQFRARVAEILRREREEE